MTEAKLILVRHGRTLLNDGMPSSEANNVLALRGILTTMSEAVMLAPEPIELVLSSPIPRAKQTAMIVVGTMGRGIPIEDCKDLEEMRPNPDEVHLERPYDKGAEKDWKKDVFAKPHWSTETQADVYVRANRFLMEHAVPHLAAGRTILVVSHYFTIRALRANIEKKDVRAMTDFRPSNSVPKQYPASTVLAGRI